MARTTYWFTYLATPTDEQIHDFILHQFEELWREYAAEREAIPSGQLHELSYAQLTSDPVAAIRAIYHTLRLEGFEVHRSMSSSRELCFTDCPRATCSIE